MCRAEGNESFRASCTDAERLHLEQLCEPLAMQEQTACRAETHLILQGSQRKQESMAVRLYDISDQVQAHGSVSCPCRCLQCVDLLCVVNGLVLDHTAACTGQVISAAGVHAATSMKCSRQKLAAWC